MARGPKHSWGHRQVRAVHLAVTLATVKPPLCCYGDGPIHGPPSEWHLAHRPDGGYYPPGQSWAHPRCNQGDPRRWGGMPNPWSRAGRARAATSLNGGDGTSRDRLASREAERLARLRRRVILPTEIERK